MSSRVISEERWRTFLEAIRDGRAVGDAATLAGFSKVAPFYRRKRDPQFAAAMNEAKVIGIKARKARRAEQTRRLLASLNGNPAPEQPGELPKVAPVPIGCIRDGTVFVDPHLLRAALQAARS